ncbi:DUF262 domain-containing protein [Flavobacterium chilense]|uniref:DUF262 domain-containing protein n=1 Tax=Flavobacterium chilense TaxID=946677 RepID=A0A1M6XEQ3_9FLAO|nr:DUF262 domain-containing protein [Flavobacterium chilense]SHL04422.1 Protein of unknown function [Flavobacterium chilense]
MEKKTLSNILEGKIFQIPDYQRGYAWEEKQWKEFVQDIDALIDDKIINHYTGTIVIYQAPHKPTCNYGVKRPEIVDVVDGQQRLTTCSLFLSIIIKELVNKGQQDYKDETPFYLYSGSKSKLRLNNETEDFYFDLISKGSTNIDANSIHQKRILSAYLFLKEHIHEQLQLRKENGVEYLKDLFDAITRKLNFSYYPIEVESEIGMTFELMNSRGKDLSSMELLKNYLMYWIYRNVPENSEKEDLTKTINKTWKEVYVNIAKCNGNETQCLRVSWTLLINHTPKSWLGYTGFKSDEVIPLRDFSIKSKENVKLFLKSFADGLALISKHYSAITKPRSISNIDKEFALLSKIRNSGNIANFLPVMIAARIKHENNEVDDLSYYNFLKAIETFSYRVFLWEGKRSNSGISSFYRWADDIYSSKHHLNSVTDWIYGAINWYSNENSFRKSLTKDFFSWYQWKKLLKYTLFEYELYLLKDKNKPKLNWQDLTDSTIEHILPQKPDVNSNWLKTWSESDRQQYMHDISNLVLTKDNSRYSNFEFERKKGTAGLGYCYSNSDIRQERKIAEFDIWNVENCKIRRNELTTWIISSWGNDKYFQASTNVVPEFEDFEETEENELLNS